MTDHLWQIYRQTDYQVVVPQGTISIRVDEPSPALDVLLREHAAGEWAFITAHNPGSEPLSLEHNQQLAAQLAASVLARGYISFPGRGVGSDPAWTPEESLLILGIPRVDAFALARQFDQNAIVVGRLGHAAELVDCRASFATG